MHGLLRSKHHNLQGSSSSSTYWGLTQLPAWLLLVHEIGLGGCLPSNLYRNSRQAKDGLHHSIWYILVESPAVWPGERTQPVHMHDECHLEANKMQIHHPIPRQYYDSQPYLGITCRTCLWSSYLTDGTWSQSQTCKMCLGLSDCWFLWLWHWQERHTHPGAYDTCGNGLASIWK